MALSVTVGTRTDLTASTSASVPCPAYSTGNLVVIGGSITNALNAPVLLVDGNTVTGTAPNQTAGPWTVIQFSATGGTVIPSIIVAYMVAASSSGARNIAMGHSSTSNISAWQAKVWADNNATPLDATTVTIDQAASLNMALPSQTIVTPNAAQDYYAASNGTATTATPPTGFTEDSDLTTSTRAFETGHILGLATGATGTRTVVWSGSVKSVGIMLAIRPRTSPLAVTRATTWATKATVVATRATAWNVKTSTAITRASTWRTLVATAVTRQTTWRTMGRIYASRATAWVTKATVGTTRASQWATKTSATITRSTAWRTLAATVATRQTTWAAKAAVLVTRATTWKTKATVGTTRQSIWRVDSTVVFSRATAWAVKAATSATRATTWRTLKATVATKQTTWTTKTTTGTTRQTTWRTLAAAVATRATSWRVRAAVALTRATQWAVAAPVYPIGKTLSTAWRTLASASTTRQTEWDTLAHTGTTRQTAWRVLTSTSLTRATTWGVKARVTVTRATSWTVKATLVTTRATAWRVLKKIETFRQTTWAVLFAPPLVTHPRATVVHNGDTATLVANQHTGVSMDIMGLNDLLPAWSCVLANGSAVYDPTGADSITIECWRNGTLLFSRTPTTVNANGTITMNWHAGDTNDPGPLKFKVIVAKSGFLPATFPPKGWMVTRVHPTSP